MHERYHLNACVKLRSMASKSMNICEVGAEVKADFIINLNTLYSQIVLYCCKFLRTSRLSIVSVKLMPLGDKVKITANVLLAEDEKKKFAREEDRYRKVEFTADNHQITDFDLNRLIKYMEMKARQDRSKANDFESLVHVRVIPCEKDDLSAEHF